MNTVQRIFITWNIICSSHRMVLSHSDLFEVSQSWFGWIFTVQFYFLYLCLVSHSHFQISTNAAENSKAFFTITNCSAELRRLFLKTSAMTVTTQAVLQGTNSNHNDICSYPP